MGHAEDILKLRKRVADAVAAGVVEPNLKDFYEATLLQVLNESERQRQVCVAQAESFRKQAAIADGQAAAYSTVGSIVYSVLNSYIVMAEKTQREEEARAAELAEKAAYAESLKEKTEVLSEVKSALAEPVVESVPTPEPVIAPEQLVEENQTRRHRRR